MRRGGVPALLSPCARRLTLRPSSTPTVMCPAMAAGPTACTAAQVEFAAPTPWSSGSLSLPPPVPSPALPLPVILSSLPALFLFLFHLIYLLHAHRRGLSLLHPTPVASSCPLGSLFPVPSSALPLPVILSYVPPLFLFLFHLICLQQAHQRIWICCSHPLFPFPVSLPPLFRFFLLPILFFPFCLVSLPLLSLAPSSFPAVVLSSLTLLYSLSPFPPLLEGVTIHRDTGQGY